MSAPLLVQPVRLAEEHIADGEENHQGAHGDALVFEKKVCGFLLRWLQKQVQPPSQVTVVPFTK